MKNKLVKFLTRKFTLLEHDIIIKSVLGKSSIPEIFYTDGRDVSRCGIVDIYIAKSDIKDNQKRIYNAAKNNPEYIEKMLKKGIAVVKNLDNRPKDLTEKIVKMNNKEIAKEINKLIDLFFRFSGYLDFSHHLGACGIVLADEEIKTVGEFHDYRNTIYRDFLLFFSKVTSAIAKKLKIKSGNLDFLSINEIINLLSNELSVQEADKLQNKRREKYIYIYQLNGCKIITNNFRKELSKIIKNSEEENNKEILGISVLKKGIIKGRVQVISQKTPMKDIMVDKIIAIPMTLPSMIPALKKVKAIITDEGGFLCHAANIAREFGVIVIVGTKIATKVLKDGDLVEVDANTGVVRILNNKKNRSKKKLDNTIK